MTRKDLVNKTAELLKQADARKHFAAARSRIHISDDFGNKKDFYIKKDDTDVLYNSKDVNVILEALAEAVLDAIRHGEKITISQLGTLTIEHKDQRRVIHPETKDWVIIPERWNPKFYPSQMMKRCATAYGIGLSDDVEFTDPDEVEVNDEEDTDIVEEDEDGEDIFGEEEE